MSKRILAQVGNSHTVKSLNAFWDMVLQTETQFLVSCDGFSYPVGIESEPDLLVDVSPDTNMLAEVNPFLGNQQTRIEEIEKADLQSSQNQNNDLIKNTESTENTQHVSSASHNKSKQPSPITFTEAEKNQPVQPRYKIKKRFEFNDVYASTCCLEVTETKTNVKHTVWHTHRIMHQIEGLDEDENLIKSMVEFFKGVQNIKCRVKVWADSQNFGFANCNTICMIWP